MDVPESHVGDQIERRGYRGNEQNRENNEADEYSFFGFGHDVK